MDPIVSYPFPATDESIVLSKSELNGKLYFGWDKAPSCTTPDEALAFASEIIRLVLASKKIKIGE